MFSDTENTLLTWKVVTFNVGHLIQIKNISVENYVKGDVESTKEARRRANKEIERWSTK